jgi:uncharacterized protein YutE (UPF0331/DUF86 family)
VRPPSDELQDKLATLAENTDELESWLADPPEPSRPRALQRVVERMVQVIVECAADAGDLWLAEHGHPLGASVRGVFQRLREAGRIPPDLDRRFADYTNTRNRIVHAYNHLDAQEILVQGGRLVPDARALLVSLTSS